jgi:hypothetical protein
LGADYEQLYAIVTVKLMMDNRRPALMRAARNSDKDEKTPKKQFWAQLLSHVLISLFVSMSLMLTQSVMVAGVIFFTYLLFVSILTLITDYSTVLLDTTDNTVILPRPVTARTLFLARLTHIALYLGQMTISLSLLPMLVFGYKFGILSAVAFLFFSVMTMLLAIVLTNLLYMLLIRFTSEERLKEIINYFQIGFTILMMLSYQILPRMMDMTQLASATFEIKWWSFFLPSVWMAGAVEWFDGFYADADHLILLILATCIPILAFLWMNRYLAPRFSRALAMMDGNAPNLVDQKQTTSRDFGSFWAKWFTRSDVEEASFRLTWKVIGRDRKFKMRVYPQMVYPILMMFIFSGSFISNQRFESVSMLDALAHTHFYLGIYWLYLIGSIAFAQTLFSDESKASWLYGVMPIAKIGEVVLGNYKAVMTKLFLPIFILISAIFLMVWSVHIIVDLAISLILMILFTLGATLFSKPSLPFSSVPNIQQQSGSVSKLILGFMLIPLLVGSHWILVRFFPVGRYILLGVLLVSLWLLFQRTRNLGWADVRY